MISPEYKALLQGLHEKEEDWGTSSLNHLNNILHFSKGHKTILDYGCGKAVLKSPLEQQGFEYTGYDPAVPEYAARPLNLQYDVVICTDVMEHVEEEHVSEVLKDLKLLTKNYLYLVIAMYPARAILPDGRNAHITLKDFDWWKAKIEEAFPFYRPGYVEHNQQLTVHFDIAGNWEY